MGLGQTLGYCTKLTQNNQSVYAFNNSQRGVHIGLMVDPSLRNDVVSPVSNVRITALNNKRVGELAWTASLDNVLGCNIYRSDSRLGKYVKVNQSPITTTTFQDSFPLNGINHYFVRAVKLEKGASGSYYNMSQGVRDTISLIGNTTKSDEIALFLAMTQLDRVFNL